ncbi:MAG: DDE-type integrase/transposase/recombinase [Miniphocaeibacter sp.]|uniref:DDE-type integrase/transposase/recombinase n=1 Tax=Miniphocaeibacter sp. TaxID=3100973 RepID=UPI001852D54F|nr:transposase family protein [Gallicola sp.]
MQENSLVSNYAVAQYKVHNLKCNESKIENILYREFNKRDNLEVIVSDLTYVRVGKSWNYICLLINLYNGEIFGYSVSKNKDAKLIEQALLSSKYSLSKIQLFHSDRGSEYDNKIIDKLLKIFKIKRSLSRKGNLYECLPQHSEGTMQ